MSQDKNIDYNILIDRAMHSIVKEALIFAQKNGLPGNHHFYISFFTNFEGVILSEKVRKNYPYEITVVLQHQFESLKVYEDKFAVTLSFSGIKEKIVVPFDALTAFADPSVRFGLQFKHDEYRTINNLEPGTEEEEETQIIQTDNTAIENKPNASNIITLDSFRKKKDDN